MGRFDFIKIAVVIGFPYLLFELLRRNESFDLQLAMPKGHFYVVSIVALVSLVIAVAVGVAGVRLRNIKIVFLSLSFISLSAIFALHGLSTPNFILHVTHLPSITSPLSVIVASIWLGLSALPSDHPWVLKLSRQGVRLIPIWTAILVASGLLLMIFPNTLDVIPLHAHPFNWTFIGITIAINLFTMFRYYQSYLYSQFPLQMAIVAVADVYDALTSTRAYRKAMNHDEAMKMNIIKESSGTHFDPLCVAEWEVVCKQGQPDMDKHKPLTSVV